MWRYIGTSSLLWRGKVEAYWVCLTLIWSEPQLHEIIIITVCNLIPLVPSFLTCSIHYLHWITSCLQGNWYVEHFFCSGRHALQAKMLEVNCMLWEFCLFLKFKSTRQIVLVLCSLDTRLRAKNLMTCSGDSNLWLRRKRWIKILKFPLLFGIFTSSFKCIWSGGV